MIIITTYFGQSRYIVLQIYMFVVAKEQDSDDEQIDKGITLKSKSIMQKTLYFLKKMK